MSGTYSRFLLVALLLVTALAGQRAPAYGAQATPTGSASFEPADCPWELPSGVEDGEDIACGYVTVPLFHDEPDGETIELAVGVLAATGDDPSDVPVMILNGGPGGNSGDILSLTGTGSMASLAEVYEGRDLIVFDQRGTGFSEPGLYCPGDVPAGEDEAIGELDPEETLEIDFGEYGQLCAEALTDEGVELAAFNTTENARDIDAIRAALGYDEVDLWGQSYGTRLALEAMRLFPDGGIRSVVLESVLPPQANTLTAEVIGLDRSLDLLFEACAEDATCAEAYPDLPELLADAYERFAAEPYETVVTDPIGGEEIDVTVDGPTYLFALYIAVYTGVLLPLVPEFIAQGAAGDTELLDLVLPVAIATTSVASGMNLAVTCQDEWGFETIAASEETVEGGDVLPVIDNLTFWAGREDRLAACDAFDLDLAEEQDEPVTSEIPALLVSGRYDPITPPTFAELAGETLENSYEVVVPNLAHTPVLFGGDCPLGIVLDFLADPTSEPESGCLDALELEFVSL